MCLYHSNHLLGVCCRQKVGLRMEGKEREKKSGEYWIKMRLGDSIKE